MKGRKSYWNGVMVVTCILCVVAALACWLVPGVRAGIIPPVGGIIWHALGSIELLIADVFRPFAYGVAPASQPWLGLVILLLMTLGSIVLISMVICLALYLLQQRPWGNNDAEGTSSLS
jgi:hypothetical protein